MRIHDGMGPDNEMNANGLSERQSRMFYEHILL